MNRIARAVGLAAVATIVASAVALQAVPGGSGSADHAEAATPMYLGVAVGPRNGENEIAAYQRVESQVGKMNASRTYLQWNANFPNGYQRWLIQQNKMLVLSIKPNGASGPIKWASIANAKPGSVLYNDMVRWAQQIKAYGKPIYVTLHHEPEAAHNTTFGTSAEYIAAWRNWVTIFRSQGVTNAKYHMILTSWAYAVNSGDRRNAAKWYPGDAYVDAIGADPYNWYTCRGSGSWTALSKIIEPFRLFGAQHPTKELWLAEFGSVEDPKVPGRKAQWLDDARALFAQPAYKQFKGLLYFDHAPTNAKAVNCRWFIDTSATSVAAFARMAGSSTFGGAPLTQITQINQPVSGYLPAQRGS